MVTGVVEARTIREAARRIKEMYPYLEHLRIEEGV